MNFRHELRIFTSWLASVFLLALGTSSQAQEMALAESPLFLGTQIDPNVFFMMDDSGSMDWEILTRDHNPQWNYWTSSSTDSVITDGLIDLYVNTGTGSCKSSSIRTYYYYFDDPDHAYDTTCSYRAAELSTSVHDSDWRMSSAEFNIMYYDPEVNYSPWIGYTDADFSNARSNPDDSTNGYTDFRDLTGFRFTVWNDTHGATLDGSGRVDGPSRATNTPNGEIDLWDSHVEYTVNSLTLDRETRTVPAAPFGASSCSNGDQNDDPPYATCYGTTKTSSSFSITDINPWGRTLAEEKQNIANWYQYARRRHFISKNAVSLVVNSNPNFRFGYSQINEWGSVFVEVPDITLDDYSTHNAALVDTMASYEWDGNGTPLRTGLEVAGRYFDNYYGAYDDPIVSECQQNYSVLFTDGYWSNWDIPQTDIGDEDGDGVGDNYSAYEPTLADVAHYFYTTDLSPLDDEVPATPIDPANHQHMVTFTVAFGVEGNLVDTDDDGYPNPELAEDDAWYSGTPNSNAEKIDDLWHAAFNSKAYFVSAQSPTEVAQAIGEALLEIADRVGSAASVATNTGSLNAGSKLFQARFDSSDWKGQLLAFNINLDGTIDGTPAWDAGDEINDQHYDTGREIITYNPDDETGMPFRFPADYTNPTASSEMTTAQINYLLTNAPFDATTTDASEINSNQTFGTDLVNYFRGDESNELTGQNFRLRNSVLGDIVNSDPNFVDIPNFRYDDNMEAKSYDSFVTANTSRQGVVYVGANDGMLHGFNSDTGDEMLGYVPGPVYENLAELATGDYLHRYYVDGGPNIIDVYMASMSDGGGGTGLWRTVLAGGLNGGGQGIYALDVTTPSSFDESVANSIVLWEFTDDDDADLGYTYGKPQMAKMQNGDWAVVFGNGYNNTESDGTASTSGHAVLYIVDVETGALIKKIDTEAGTSGTPNGLATPLMIDPDGDDIVDYIYAGDMLGNMWKFDVSSASVSDWDVAWDDGGTPEPLFTTQTGQPITSQPQATLHPDNLEGFMIFFGTGQYLEEDDNLASGQDTQTFYGIWDVNDNTTTPNITTSNLRSQSITNQFEQDFDTNDDGIDDETFLLRNVSDNEIDWDTHLGWYLDLYPTNIEGVANTSNFGERQTSNAIVRAGRVIFTTLIPSEVECEFGGTSFLMELDFRDGGALEFPAFDLNGDGEYDADDTDASGRASDVGIMPTVSILADDAQDVAFGSGASGDIDVIEISVGDQSYGRQSWRQIE